MIRRVAVLLALCAGTAWACSGEGAAATIGHAELLGWVLLGVAVVVMLVASVLSQRRGNQGSVLGMGWVLVVAHPGIWISARSGDCGRTRIIMAVVFTLLAGGVLGWLWMRPPKVSAAPPEGAPRE